MSGGIDNWLHRFAKSLIKRAMGQTGLVLALSR